MNFSGNPIQYGIPGGAATAVADPFDKSPLNPVNMSRTADCAAMPSANAPSAKLLERVRVAAADLAELASVQAGWRYVSDKHNTTVYEMNGAVLPSTVSVASTFGGVGGRAADYYLVKGVTSVRADVDQMLALLAAANTDDFSLRMNQIFSKYYQNSAMIDDMSCTAPPAQFLSEDGSVRSFTEDDAYTVNWLALKSGGSGDAARDFTLASYQDAFQRDTRGRLVRLGRSAARPHPGRADRLLGVHTLSSFNFKDIPELPKSKATDRLHFRNTGFVVEETHERGVFRVSFFLSLMPVATTLRTPKKYEKWLQKLAFCVGNLALQVKAPAPQPAVTLTPSGRVEWKNSDHCMLCLKTFYAFRRCHHCRFCGEAVCNKCSGFIDVSRFDVMQALQGRVRAATSAAISQHYSETRGCTRCIRNLMEDMHNATLVAAAQEHRRASTPASHTSSNASGHRHGNKLLASFASNARSATNEDDELSSLDGSISDRPSNDSTSSGRQRRQTAPMGSGIPRHAHPRDGALTLEDLDECESPMMKSMLHVKPPLDPKNSLSMSTASTAFSHASFDDRVSGASRDTNGSQAHQRFAASLTSVPATPAAEFRDEMSFGSDDYSHEADVMALAGLTLHDSTYPYELHDEEVDIDAPPQFARSMTRFKATSDASVVPPRLTSSSNSSNSSNGSGANFKFSRMNHSEPDAEPSFEPQYAARVPIEQRSVRIGRLNEFAASHGAYASTKHLFSASAGPRLRAQQQQQSQQRQPQFPTRPPRHQPYAEKARSSSSASSMRSSDDMFQLPPAALAAAGGQDDFQSDMILLTPDAKKSQDFVVFSDSHRESIFVRPGDGSDMIPLKF